MGKVAAVCLSEKRGTRKSEQDRIRLIADWGIEGDAHAGKWHRQVSLLSSESIEEFRKKGVNVRYGAFGENIVVSGIPLRNLPVGTELSIGECLLEITQIGKVCHSHCAIYEKTGTCLMPQEGVFAVVKKSGFVRPGDEVEVIPARADRAFTAAVITLSDRASEGVYEDRSGLAVREILEKCGYVVMECLLLPDGKERLKKELVRLADERQPDVIFTTGGTGFSPRDLTPEATKEVSDREVPGIGEALRGYSARFTDHAMLSRQTAGIRGKTLIVNLPGSPKACREDLDFLLKPLAHGLMILRGAKTDENR